MKNILLISLFICLSLVGYSQGNKITVNNYDIKKCCLGQVYHDSTLTGKGTQTDPLKVAGAKIYDGIISQAGTSAPIENVVHENGLTGPVVYTYISPGKYNIQVPGSTGWANTSIYPGAAFGGTNVYTLSIDPTFSDNFQLQVFDNTGTNVNDGLNFMPLLIKVYP